MGSGANWSIGIPTLTAIDDGGTQHRKDGADPFLGVLVAEGDCVTPFDVAELIVGRRGVGFAQLVAEEIQRWGAWHGITKIDAGS